MPSYRGPGFLRGLDILASLPAEFPSQVLEIAIVLTGRLDDVAIRHQLHLFLHLPRLGINLWVVDRNLNFHVPEVRPPGKRKALREKIIQPRITRITRKKRGQTLTPFFRVISVIRGYVFRV